MTQPITENGTSDGEPETSTRLKKTDIKDTAIPDTTTLDQRNLKCLLKKLNLEFSQQK